ncbi:unnamed protein product [Dovyalis caffra]|uniref:Protein kinase domain-containing protein n=1 Tax=Dovyalis caffra TaxID=77055 RepID=A0AAV1SMS1_9ROSI|nr:unnamed protein product [Dovyalis caffra]
MLSRQNFLAIFPFFFCFFSSSSSNPDFITLLSFKSSLLESPNVLSTWENSTNPCTDSWLGVTCNPTTQRVTKLVLENLNLTGSIDELSQLTQLRLLSLKQNHLSSAFDLNFSSLKNLKLLYLSHNRISGNFPTGIHFLRRLRRLDLSYNYFYGEIPLSELTQLPRLLTLRLEFNSFTGKIKPFSFFPSGSILDFNVSNNYLSGEIPSSFSRFPASSFSGNKNLCGKPLALDCFHRTVESEPAKSGDVGLKNKRKDGVSDWVVLLIITVDAVAILAALVTIACCCYYKKRRSSGAHEGIKRKVGSAGSFNSMGGFYGGGGDEVMVVFDGCKGFGDVDDLLKSSAELLGKGCVGTTYKVLMDGGDVVVVKRVKERRKRKEVDGWLRIIGGIRHSNIVSLRAYCNSNEELLLVYDFLPNGSLHSLLHGNRGPGRTPLDWTTRLKLATGSALDLAFLHGYNKAKLFHGNLTSSNIIVDRLGNACISEIGLHQLLHPSSISNSAYKAPELMSNNQNTVNQRRFTQKCDVYSFGVILLEILTGKMPNGEGETSLVKWVQRVAREEWTWEVFDFELLRYKEMEEEMVGLMQVALLCLAPLPRDRPRMSMVHMMIEDIRSKGGRQLGDRNSIMNDHSSDLSPSLSESTINFTSGG